MYAELDHAWRQRLRRSAEINPDVGHALLCSDAQRVRVPIAEASGRIAAAAIVPYPPGVALVWPGERLEAVDVQLVQKLASAGIACYGFDDGQVTVLKS